MHRSHLFQQFILPLIWEQSIIFSIHKCWYYRQSHQQYYFQLIKIAMNFLFLFSFSHLQYPSLQQKIQQMIRQDYKDLRDLVVKFFLKAGLKRTQEELYSIRIIITKYQLKLQNRQFLSKHIYSTKYIEHNISVINAQDIQKIIYGINSKIYIIYNSFFILQSSMYFDTDENSKKSDQQTKTVYIYENSCNNKQPIQYKIRNQNNILKDIARIFKFKKIRLFNQEGAEYFQDDLRFVKNKTSLYASRGEEFDPHNCFGQYEIVRKLGQGGFGQVFLANHKHSGEKCAIKIIKISSVSDIDSIFVEAQILKSLKHENIVKVTNCLTLKNMQVAIIMEYLQGGQLYKYVQNAGRLDEQTCKIFCRQIVKGIMYCHENNLIHRDLKLQNIVLVNSEEKKIKIIDFGIAGVMNRLTQQDLDVGSLGYMAPECFLSPTVNQNNVKFDGRMDVWAIGVILYGMLCAQLPFKGNNNYEIKQNIKKAQYKLPNQVKKSLSKQCLSFLFRCLDPNPKTRIKISELMIHTWLADKLNRQIHQHPQTILQEDPDELEIQRRNYIESELYRQKQIQKEKRIIETDSTKQVWIKKSHQQKKTPSIHKNSNSLNIRSNVPSVYKGRQNLSKNKGKQNIQKQRN